MPLVHSGPQQAAASLAPLSRACQDGCLKKLGERGATGVVISDVSSVLTTAVDWGKLQGVLPEVQMTEEQLKAFLNAVKADPQLQEKLMAESDASAVAEIAKAAGFAISA